VAFLACRIGLCLCIVDREFYSLVFLDDGTATQLLPISQVPLREPGARPYRPMIQVVSDEKFLILSWTGTGAMGLFINLNGDPVCGTLQWSSHPLSVCSFSHLLLRLIMSQRSSTSRPYCKTKRSWFTTSSRRRLFRQYRRHSYRHQVRRRSLLCSVRAGHWL
jgi:hypothetical protein